MATISNKVLYPMLVISTNIHYVKELHDVRADILDKCESSDVFGLFLLNGLKTFLKDFKVTNNTTIKEGAVIKGRLSMRETLRRQSLSRNRVCYTAGYIDYDKDLIGIVKHTLNLMRRYVSNPYIKQGLNNYSSHLEKYKPILCGMPQIRSEIKIQSNTGVKNLLTICLLVRMHIEYNLSDNASNRGRATNDKQVLGYIFQNYIKDRLTKYVEESKKSSDKKNTYNLAPLSEKCSDGYQKYDYHFTNDEINCVVEVKYTSGYFKHDHKHEIRDFMATQHDTGIARSTLGMLIYAKLPRGKQSSEDDFDIVKRDDYKRNKNPNEVLYKYRANINLSLDVDSIETVNQELYDKVTKVLDAVHYLNEHTDKDICRVEV